MKKTEQSFVVLSCLCILIAIGLTIYKMATVNFETTDFTFALLVLTNAGFCLFYVIHGVLKERAYELGILLIAVLAVSLFSILNYFLVPDDEGPVKLARLIIVCVMSPPVIVFCIKYGLEYFGTRQITFGEAGNASKGIQNIWNKAYFLLDLIKLDFQLEISMTVLILNSTKHLEIDDYILGLGILISIIWFIIGHYSCRPGRENKIGMGIFIAEKILEPVYTIYKIIKSIEQEEPSLKYATIACGTLALIIRAVLLFFTYLVVKNFDRRLQIIESPSANSTTELNVNSELSESNPLLMHTYRS